MKKPEMKVKIAICSKCGKRLPGIAPMEATIVCFDCTNPKSFSIPRERKDEE